MIVASLYFAVYFGLFLFMLVQLFRANWHKTVAFSEENPKVSILIAARNEAHNIERCLQSLNRLSYSPQNFEVLIGNDQSTDNTAALIEAFIKDKPNFRLLNITEDLGLAKGKANVLAHLTKQASSNYFFITDADMELPENWIEAMLAPLKPETGIVTGITAVSGAGIFNAMQRIDWVYSLGLIQIVSDLGLPVTTMGNNMLITREAYESVGGYENLEFSITEDIALFREVLKQGFGYKNVYNRQILAFTQPANSLHNLLQQRKRWFTGLNFLPMPMKILLVIYAGFYAFLVPFFWLAPVWLGVSILGLKWFCQSLFLQRCFKKIGLRTTLIELISFEFYQVFLAALMLFFYFLPVPVNWKGRKY